MTSRSLYLLLLMVLVAAAGSLSGQNQLLPTTSNLQLPLFFVANTGQTDSSVRYLSQGPGYTLFLTSREAIFRFVDRGAQSRPRQTFDRVHGRELESVPPIQEIRLALQFLGGNPEVELEGLRERHGKVHYLIGNNPTRWRRQLPTYEEVAYRQLWPGIDLVLRGANGQLKYEFVLYSGARVETIQLAYRGAEGLSLDEEGNLLIRTALGVLRDEKPYSYQEIAGQQVPVESRFVLLPGQVGEASYGFAVSPDYDARYPLIIDPTLVYSTYVGGTRAELGCCLALDTSGNAYVTGITEFSDFPTTTGVFQPPFGGGIFDVFVFKLSADGSTLVYATYLGGSSDDEAGDIAVDASGHAYVTGSTESMNFPITPGAFDTTHNGGFDDAFVTKLSADGSSLIYSTYLGGGMPVSPFVAADSGGGIAVDSSGNAYVVGQTHSTDFPVVGGFSTSHSGGNGDFFITKLNPSGSNLLYSTYLGGSDADQSPSLTLDTSGNVYVTGLTFSTDFPTTSGAFDTSLNLATAGFSDAIVSKLNPSLTGAASLIYSTYLGGTSGESAGDIAVDASGNAYVTGDTTSEDFPTTRGAFDRTSNSVSPPSNTDAYVVKLNATGSGLIYGTYLGGSLRDGGNGIAVDSAGVVHVTGFTESNLDFPIAPSAFDPTFNGDFFDAFVAKLGQDGDLLVDSTYLGGTGNDFGISIAVDASSAVYVAGNTTSSDFPTTLGAFDRTFNGIEDVFVTKLELAEPPPVTAVSIDIKPGSFPNSINLGSGGNVPVAIFSSAGFNATSVDPLTVVLASAPVKLKGNGTVLSSFQDVNGDGLADQVVHVETQALQLSETDTEAVLKGKTFSGDLIRGTDSVRVVP